MARVVAGSIPDKITYTFSGEEEVFVGSTWDINWEPDEGKYKSLYNKEKVLPAFVSDTDANNVKRAQQWAAGWKKNPTTSIETNNTPIKNIKILSLESRGRGGRAYKALIDKYYVDFREDVLMDTMLQTGIAPGGILQGEFVWAKLTGQMKLVRVGSELHKMILDFDSNKNAKPIGKKALEVGGIYQDRKKNKAIFLGYVNTTIFKSKDEAPYYKRKSATFDFEHKKVKKGMLFYEMNYGSLEENIKTIRHQNSSFKFQLKNSHSYIEKVGQVEIDSVDLITFIRERARKEIKTKILQFTGHDKPDQQNGYSKITDTYLEDTIEYSSRKLNIYPYQNEPVDTFDVKKYLIFS